MSLGLVVLEGRLVKDPTMKYTEKGSSMTAWRMAVDAGWGDQKHTQWWNCTAFEKTGEVVNNFLKAGSPITVVGRIRVDPETGCPRIYQREDGTWASSLDLTVTEVSLPPKPKAGGVGE